MSELFSAELTNILPKNQFKHYNKIPYNAEIDCRAYIPTKGFFLGLYSDRIIYRRGYFRRGKCIAYDVKSVILGQALGFLWKSPQKERTLRTENHKLSQIKYSNASETACCTINILLRKVRIPCTSPLAYIRGAS